MRLLFALLWVGLASAQTGVWPPSGGGGTTLPSTTAILKGNGTGGAVAATAGTDYQAVLGFTPVSTTGSYTNPAWIVSLPTSKVTGLAAVATSNSYADLTNKPITPLTIGFGMLTGATGTNVSLEIPASHSSTIGHCVVRVKASDASTALTFRVNRNGTSIFTADQTIAAATAAHTTVDLTSALAAAQLTVTRNDIFTIDITSGTANWNFTVGVTD